MNLEYTNLVAAQSGRVVKLSGAEGTFATAGQSLMMFVPDEVWITANYKETQLADMRPGQPVEIRIDAYPGYSAKLESVVEHQSQIRFRAKIRTSPALNGA